MIESQTSKSINVICFTESPLKFYPQNRIEKNVKERSLATLGSKIIHSPKESINRDWNNEEELDKRPYKTSHPTCNCNPSKKACPLNRLMKYPNQTNCKTDKEADRAY
jgi:hypothetical protein